MFTLEAVSLGNVSRLVVSRSESCPGRGWYLDKIIVRDGQQPKLQHVFPCRRYALQASFKHILLNYHDDDDDDDDVIAAAAAAFSF